MFLLDASQGHVTSVVHETTVLEDGGAVHETRKMGIADTVDRK
jgi:hypothetical protein